LFSRLGNKVRKRIVRHRRCALGVADARAEGKPKLTTGSPRRGEPDPHVGVAASVCSRAFHAGTPVCSVGSRATRSRSVCGDKKGITIKGGREKERRIRLIEKGLISSISKGERKKREHLTHNRQVNKTITEAFVLERATCQNDLL